MHVDRRFSGVFGCMDSKFVCVCVCVCVRGSCGAVLHILRVFSAGPCSTLVFSPARSSPGPTHAAAGPARDRLLAVSRQGESECVSVSVSECVFVSVYER